VALFLICLFVLVMVAPVLARNLVGGCLLLVLGIVGILGVILFLAGGNAGIADGEIDYREWEGLPEDVGEEPPLVAETDPEPAHVPYRPVPLSEWRDYRSDVDPECVDAMRGQVLAQRAWSAGRISDEDMRRISIEAYDLCTN